MKRILSLAAALFVAGTVASAEGASYATRLSEAKKAEGEGKYATALGSYWDAMDAEPTEKAEEAYNGYKRIADAIRSGKPGKDGTYDDFDLYDGWIELYKDYVSYWNEKSPFRFVLEDFSKGDLDMATRTANYNVKIKLEKTQKYSNISSIMQKGLEESRRSEWNEVPYDWEETVTRSSPYFSKGNYEIVLYLTNEKKTELARGEKQELDSYYTVTYNFNGVSRDSMKVIDAGNYNIIVDKVWCNSAELADEELKFPYNDTNAPVAVQLKVATKSMFVTVRGGTYTMGSNNGSSDEKPVHSVTLSTFDMMNTEVPQWLYEAVMGRNPSYYKGTNKPVERVSWYDAIDFCNKLSEMQGLTPCYTKNGDEWECNFKANGYRLPTEAEWEYAACGGINKSPFKYSGSGNINDVAWYTDNRGGAATHDVGTKKPNVLGLYDMSGNVWEWCWDRYGSYTRDPATNPSGASSGDYRVNRGGSYDSYASNCTVSYRNYYYPGYDRSSLGFRVVRSSSGK